MPPAALPPPPGFAELSKADQITYLQSLWERIAANPEDIPVAESHLRLAEERLREYRMNPSDAVPAFEFLSRRH